MWIVAPRAEATHLEVTQVADMSPTAQVGVNAFDVHHTHWPYVVIGQPPAPHLADEKSDKEGDICTQLFCSHESHEFSGTTHCFNFRVICSQFPHCYRDPVPDFLVHALLQGLDLLCCHQGGVQLNDTSLTAQLPAPRKSICCCRCCWVQHQRPTTGNVMTNKTDFSPLPVMFKAPDGNLTLKEDKTEQTLCTASPQVSHISCNI